MILPKENYKTIRKFLIVPQNHCSALLFLPENWNPGRRLFLQSKITRKSLIVSQNHCSDLLKAVVKVTANRLMASGAPPEGCHSCCDNFFCIPRFCSNPSRYPLSLPQARFKNCMQGQKVQRIRKLHSHPATPKLSALHILGVFLLVLISESSHGCRAQQK